MRREDFLKTGGSDLPPFAEDLVFWAPLTQGDLTDHISGQTLVYDSNYVTYDNAKQSYLFTKSYNTQESYFSVNIKPYMTNDGYALFCQCQPTGLDYNLNFPGYFVIGGYADNNSWKPSVQYIKSEPSDKRDLFLKRARVFDLNGGYNYLYSDGVQFLSEANSSICNSSNWSNNMTRRVAVNPCRESRDTIGAYVKDIRIYNRVLSASEVAQL